MRAIRVQAFAALLISVSATTAFAGDSRGKADFDCSYRPVVQSLLSDFLPFFQLPLGEASAGACRCLARGDFNGDGSEDYAAVLTETAAPRSYGDGTPVQSSYITIFLSQPTPYAPYQALVLLGYRAAAGSYSLSVEKRGRLSDLVVVMQGYSRSRLRWNGRGFEIEHHAD